MRLVPKHWDASRRYPPGFGPGEPWYEPAHLRHKPGDDWEIGGRPHDPDDPGPFGSPGWYQDRRTGRHRRGELPDPLPEDETARTATYRDPNRGPEPHRFSRLREDAYHAFMRDSEELHRAHFETADPSRALVRLKWILRVLLAVLYWRVLPFPERPAPRPKPRTAPPRTMGRDARPGPTRGRAPSPTPRRTVAAPHAASAPQVFFEAVRAARLEGRVVEGGMVGGGAR